MTCGWFDFACHVGNGLDGLGSFLFGWFFAIPWGWFIAGLIIGAVLGAQFGWLAVVSIGTSVLVGFLGPRIFSGAREPTDIDGPDAEPPVTRRPPRQRKPLFPRNPKPSTGRRRYNQDTNQFEDY